MRFGGAELGGEVVGVEGLAPSTPSLSSCESSERKPLAASDSTASAESRSNSFDNSSAAIEGAESVRQRLAAVLARLTGTDLARVLRFAEELADSRRRTPS